MEIILFVIFLSITDVLNFQLATVTLELELELEGYIAQSHTIYSDINIIFYFLTIESLISRAKETFFSCIDNKNT